MRGLGFERLLDWTLTELDRRGSIFGIPRSLFYFPRIGAPFVVPDLFGQYLATPVGPAAGPHTQLAQNIVCAWLSGARFIELKTVQACNDFEISRPCIDMEDEGYNVEWSQELKPADAAREYIHAWALIHVLHRLLAMEGPIGTIFNISVGYDLEGIQGPVMSRFLDAMADAGEELAKVRGILQRRLPNLCNLDLPDRISNNVTLSTMHGCPPDEIERIASYLMGSCGLHTYIKLNPTLLGKEAVDEILHESLGYQGIRVPEAVFEQDLRFSGAVDLVRSLQKTAAACHRTFGVKIGNTLATVNCKRVLSGEEAYMSGRALFPLAIELFRRLAAEFDGGLNVSFSGGADAFNVAGILACGALPVTAASDLLKPGGYSRLLQYLENIESAMKLCAARDLENFSRDRAAQLEKVACRARGETRYFKSAYAGTAPKIRAELGYFDCIAAPCVEQCAVRQDIPEYVRLIARGEYDRALEVILAHNPFPAVTGYLCTQLCRQCCTRTAGNYEEPVAIRALKRFAAEKGKVAPIARPKTSGKVAIIGAGPSGLSAAWFLALNGIEVTLFEAKDVAGGMMRLAPAFRLPPEILREDIERILSLGVNLKLSCPVNATPETLLQSGFDAAYIASGFAKDVPLGIEGVQGGGVFPALEFLERVRSGKPLALGRRILVIGGGNTALDAARTAHRITKHPVTVVYRRSRAEMPAGHEDQRDAFEEGIQLTELASPIRIIRNGKRIVGLECLRNELGAPGPDGRRRPMPIRGSRFRIPADAIIAAIGQSPEISFLDGCAAALRHDGAIQVDPKTGLAGPAHVYAGGDAVRGPASIIAACADGRRAAGAICAGLGAEFCVPGAGLPPLSEEEIAGVKRARARREVQRSPERLALDRRGGFELVESTLTEEAARAEAARCLQCSEICDKCIEVCPNRANQSYWISPGVVAGIRQSRQILHIHDLCNECGNCATFCVYQGKPFRDKPRLFMNYEDFCGADDNAFHLRREDCGWTLLRRRNGETLPVAFSQGLQSENPDETCAIVHGILQILPS